MLELELGELVEPELELGVLDESELLLDGDDVLPDVEPEAPVELEPWLAKYASHSARETCPSLFVSADEKFGVELLLDEVPPADDVSEELLELEPDVEGLLDDEDGVLDDVDGVLDEDDDCATASVDSAKSTAAVMMLRLLGMDCFLQRLNRAAPAWRASPVPPESSEGLPIATLVT